MTSDRLNEASFRRKLNRISKNIIKNKNPIKLLFSDIKHFDTQNPVIGYLICEIDIGKKKDLSKLLRKAPDVKDLELWSRFTKFNAKDNFLNRRNGANNKNNNNNFLPPPSPPLPSARNFSPLSYLPPPSHPPTLSDFFWDDPGENLSQ